MIQYIIKIYNVELRILDWLMQWVGVCYFLFRLWWQLLCCSGSVTCMWRCSAGCVSVVFYTGVISGAFVQRLRLWYLHLH